MFQEIPINLSKSEKDQMFLDTIKGYLDSTLPVITNLANFSAIVNVFFDDLNWAGFYLLHDGKLLLGPFQGKPACVEIPYGKGVCGTVWQSLKPLIVENTHAFPGHIACDGASNSEIVLPIVKNGQFFGVLDLDSPSYDRFNQEDQMLLEKALNVLIDILP